MVFSRVFERHLSLQTDLAPCAMNQLHSLAIRVSTDWRSHGLSSGAP
jgi:hypothetical protein